jgi:hypothetical protein
MRRDQVRGNRPLPGVIILARRVNPVKVTGIWNHLATRRHSLFGDG